MRNLLAISVAACLAQTGAGAAQQTLLFNNFLPPNDVFNENVVQPWIADIERVTEGRVVIEQPSASLAPPPELLTMVQQGIADGAFTMVGFVENTNPVFEISLLPQLATTAESASVAAWRTYEQFFAGKNDLEGVELLGIAAVSGGSLYNSSETPFASVADLSNVKMWALPGSGARTLGALGTVVTPGPAVRMYEVISGGVVDAFCCINYESIEVFNVESFAKSVTEVPGGVFAPTFAFFIKSDVWDGIPAEDQALIRSVSGEVIARRAAKVDELNDAARQRYLDRGKPIDTASDAFQAEMEAAWAPLTNAWIAAVDAVGVDGQAALDFYRAEMAKVAAGE